MWHRQGKVSLTKGSDVVTGVGTDWVENIRVGDAFQGPDGKLYQVINVASNEALAISPAYEGATATNLNYWIVPVPGYSKTQADRLSLIISKLDGDIVTATEAADRAQAAAQQAQQWRNEAAVSAAAALQSEQNAALSADIAEQARDDAVAVVTGGTASIDPQAGKIPIAGAEASIKQAWIENLQFELDALRVAKNRLLYGDGPYPVLDFQFAGAKYLDPRIQFTRFSADWDEYGMEYRINEPILIDKGFWASQGGVNLLEYSSDLGDPRWSKTNVKSTSGKEAAFEVDQGSRSYIQQSGIALVGGVDYEILIFVKNVNDGGVAANTAIIAVLNLPDYTGSISLQARDLINGVNRIKFTPANNSIVNIRVGIGATNATNGNAATLEVKDIQLVEAGYSGAFIPTAQSSIRVTQGSARIPSMPLPEAGAVIVVFTPPETLPGSNVSVLTFLGSSLDNQLRIYFNSNSKNLTVRWRSGGVDYYNQGVFSGALQRDAAVGVSWHSGHASVFLNGSTVASFPIATVPEVEDLWVGSFNETADFLNSFIRSAIIFDKIITSEDMERLTS